MTPAAAKPKPKKPADGEVERPDVELHDEVYFRHAKGPKCGRVVSHGKHGAMVEADGEHHKVRWEHVLGHKVKVRPGVKVVDEGVDGMIVEDAAGRRRYVHDPIGDDPPPLTKSFMPRIVFFGRADELAKAISGGRGIKNRPGLTQKDITDKRGHTAKRWVRTSKPEPKQREAKAEERPVQAGGQSKYQPGDKVAFQIGGAKGSGEVVGDPGAHGAHVRDETGHLHQVTWESMKPAAEHQPDKEFEASEYGRSTDDAKASVDSILAGFPENTKELILKAEAKLSKLTETHVTHDGKNGYTPERQALHRQIIFDGVTDENGKFHPGILSPERMSAAKPQDGQKPVFTLLGGRGGSGKSWFSKSADSPVDTKRAIVLDADEIKGLLPEYKGWNAHQVHEESGDIFDAITDICRVAGLNLVHDATMKSGDKVAALVEGFKKSGYEVETHYMHLPRHEAAKRAVGRFLTEKGDGSGRYVPVDVVLKMVSNEDSFDRVKPMVDRWSFRDNNVGKGQEPKLIAEGGRKKTGEG